MNSSKPKILIVRLSSIGDIVLTTPVIRCVKQQLDGAEVHFLTKKNYSSILEANPYIDKLHLMDKGLSEVIPDLREEKFDFIIDLHRNIRSRLLILALRRLSGTFNKLNFRKWVLVNFKKNLLPDIHIVDRYFKAASRLGVVNDNEGLDFFIDEEKVSSNVVLPETHSGGYIGIVIGSKHNTKMFPVHRIIEVCDRIKYPVVLLGGKEDQAKGEVIKQASKSEIYNSCGQYSIAESAFLVSRALKIVANDTGLMHIAAAFRKPVLSVWGNTVPEFGMYPYMPGRYESNSRIMEVKGLSCRPCSKLGMKECPKKHFRCMEDISVDDIVSWCNENIQ